MQCGIVEGTPDEWAVCLHNDIVLRAIVHDRPLLIKRMKLQSTVRIRESFFARRSTYLYLIHGWHFETGFSNLFEMFDVAG